METLIRRKDKNFRFILGKGFLQGFHMYISGVNIKEGFHIRTPEFNLRREFQVMISD